MALSRDTVYSCIHCSRRKFIFLTHSWKAFLLFAKSSSTFIPVFFTLCCAVKCSNCWKSQNPRLSILQSIPWFYCQLESSLESVVSGMVSCCGSICWKESVTSALQENCTAPTVHLMLMSCCVEALCTFLYRGTSLLLAMASGAMSKWKR